MRIFFRISGVLGFCLAMMVCFTGCTQRIIDFTVISSKNVDMRVKDDGKGSRVEGKASVPVFFIPLGRPNLKEAVDRAIESAGPGYDALIDGVVYYYAQAFIVGTVGYKVEGTPVKTNQIITELHKSGSPVLYHSSLNISNDESFENLRVEVVMEEPIKAQ